MSDTDIDKTGSPSQHFAACGPFCKHVTFCYACSATFSVCPKHRENPNDSVQWADEQKDEP